MASPLRDDGRLPMGYDTLAWDVSPGKAAIMANQANSLSHTKWMCKYHIVSAPKYRRKITCNQYRDSLGGYSASFAATRGSR